MKKVLICFVVIFLVIVNNAASQQTTADFEKLSWLEGDWIRTNATSGRSGYEHWEKRSATEWQGTGITMKGADTTVVEKMKLIVKEGLIYFVADVPENNGEVFFKITRLDENGFACENPAHDFPKKIEYLLTGNTLKAVISGDGKSIAYLFKRK
jgi:hypothetical protein